MFSLHIIRFDEIDSTNTESAATWNMPGKVLYGLPLSRQTDADDLTQMGKHQGPEPAGHPAAKTVFLPANKQFLISKCTALAICDFLVTLGLSPRIKWPNDIYIGPNKICGILIEHQLSRNNLTSSIIGFGINVNQEQFGGAPNPSIVLETGIRYNVDELLPKVLLHIQKWYQTLYDGDSGKIDRSYEKLLVNEPDYEKNRAMDQQILWLRSRDHPQTEQLPWKH